MKWNRVEMESKEIGILTEVEALVVELLATMQQEKDPQKWHENLFGNKRCKPSNKSRKRSSSMVSNIPSQQALNHDHGDNPPDLPPFQFLQGHILECSKPLEKQLQKSDVNENLNRLLLNKKHAENFFLSLLRNDISDENITKGIQVFVYDMHGNKYTMIFKKWAEKYYVLNGEWKDFFQNHTLQDKDFIKVWMFRHSVSNNLCFALSIRRSE